MNSLSENVDIKFQNLNDRITCLSNQNKLSEQFSTSSVSELHQEMKSFKIDLDKKTNAILSKTQNVFDKIKSTPDLVGHRSSVESNSKKENAQDTSGVLNNSNNSQPNVYTSERITHSQTSSAKQRSQHNPNTRDTIPKTTKRDLTLITGSDVLTSLEPNFLGTHVRVKSFKNASISNMKDKLSTMDLSRYENVILHAGGQDVDAKVSKTNFKETYNSLLSS